MSKAKQISRIISTDDPTFGPEHRTIHGETYPVCPHWVGGALESAQGKGLILSALLDRGEEFGLKLYYIGDHLWSCELWGKDAMHEATGATPFDAVLAAYFALKPSGDA